jgi:hypothetical protein
MCKTAFVSNGWQISVIDSRKKVKLCTKQRAVIIEKNEKFGFSPTFWSFYFKFPMKAPTFAVLKKIEHGKPLSYKKRCETSC